MLRKKLSRFYSIYTVFRLSAGVLAANCMRSRSIVSRFNVPGTRKIFSINSWQFVTYGSFTMLRNSGANVEISSHSRISSLLCRSRVRLTRNKIWKKNPFESDLLFGGWKLFARNSIHSLCYPPKIGNPKHEAQIRPATLRKTYKQTIWLWWPEMAFPLDPNVWKFLALVYRAAHAVHQCRWWGLSSFSYGNFGSCLRLGFLTTKMSILHFLWQLILDLWTIETCFGWNLWIL